MLLVISFFMATLSSFFPPPLAKAENILNGESIYLSTHSSRLSGLPFLNRDLKDVTYSQGTGELAVGLILESHLPSVMFMVLRTQPLSVKKLRTTKLFAFLCLC